MWSHTEFHSCILLSHLFPRFSLMVFGIILLEIEWKPGPHFYLSTPVCLEVSFGPQSDHVEMKLDHSFLFQIYLLPDA